MSSRFGVDFVDNTSLLYLSYLLSMVFLYSSFMSCYLTKDLVGIFVYYFKYINSSVLILVIYEST